MSEFNHEEELFDAARRLTDPRERDRFLDERCAGDGPLRRRLGQLLAALQESDDYFRPASPASAMQRPPATSTSADVIGSRIGRYELLEKIGEGGFGVVYVAEQTEPVKRRVALKVIKLGMDTRQVVARFEAERQALALMDHPNIARVHDGGATETGRPYFVMELAQGVPITQYSDDQKLSIRERLELFMPVCQAVQHAHQKGIIHRDLKPSNILVTVNDGVPVPKVIDFGVAKATQQELTEKTIVTQFHQFIGTPAYMSPEQAEMRSVDIDTRSDIYSLGVLLYELLTGKTPFDGRELLASGLDEMRRTIREKEAVKPSTRLAHGNASPPSELARTSRKRQIDADLDWIVMKCLEKERNRRYETANGLSADIQHFLDSEPVAARPPSAAYRFQKLVRRHKLPFAAGTFALVVLLLAVAVSTWQAVKARRAEQEARTIKDFLTEQLLGGRDPFAPGFDPNRRVVLDGIAHALEGRFAGQPLIEAEVRHAVGFAFGECSAYAEAAMQLEKALAIRVRLLGRGHPDTLLTAAELVPVYSSSARKNDADQLLNDTIAAARRAPNRWSRGLGLALYGKGWMLHNEVRPKEALPYLIEAIEVLKRSVGENDVKVTEVMWAVASSTQQLKKWDEAARLWEEGLRRSERLHGAEHWLTMGFLNAQAEFFRAQGQTERARPLLEKVIAINTRTLGPDNKFTLAAEDSLAWDLANKGWDDEAAGRFAGLFRRYSKMFPAAFAVNRCHDYAGLFVQHQRFDEARKIVSQIKDSLQVRPPDRVRTFDHLLTATAAADGWPAASDVCRRHLELFPESLPAWLTKAWVFRYVGDEDHYRQVVNKVLALPTNEQDQENQHVPIEVAALGSVPLSAQQRQQIEALIRALESALPGRSRDLRARGYRAIGQMQLRLGQLEPCLATLEKAGSARTNRDPYILFIKADCLHRLGRTNEALVAFDEAETAMKPLVPEPLSQTEGFLEPYKIYRFLLMHREVGALLAGDQRDRAGQ